jgi:hypothetical protein
MAKSKEMNASSLPSADMPSSSSSEIGVADLRQATETISKQFAATFNSLSNAFLARNEDEKDDGCWIIDDDNNATKQMTRRSHKRRSSNVYADGEIETDAETVDTTKEPSPMARMRDVSDQGSVKATPLSTPSRRNVDDIKKSWQRQMKKAQRLKEREQLSLQDEVSEMGDDGRLLDPIFSAAMVLSEIPSAIPNAQKEIMNYFSGQCGIDDASTDSDSSNDVSSYEDSQSTPRRHRRRRQRRSKTKSTPRRRGLGLRSRSRASEGRRRFGTRVAEPQTPEGSKAAFAYQTPPRKSSSPDKIKENLANFNTDAAQTLPAAPPAITSSYGDAFQKRIPTSTAPTKNAGMNPKDKGFVKAFIQDISSRGFRVLWYKEPFSKEPASIHLFLQHGHQTQSGEHCGPALVWADNKEKDQFLGVNLFDIHALDRANARQLGARSLVMPGRSVSIRLSKGNNFIFEAETEEDAARFVYGMKWVIARLAFNLVIGNMDASCELVDVGPSPSMNSSTQQVQSSSSCPKSPLEEVEATRAIDDISLQMVNKSIFRRVMHV